MKKLNTLEYFYNKQIRKDLIEKLNVTSLDVVDLNCLFIFKGYTTFLPSDRNFNKMSSISVFYKYLLESVFCQKVEHKVQIKKNLIQRDLPSTYFNIFKCTIRKRQHFFSLLLRFFLIVLFNFKKKTKRSKQRPKFIFYFLKNIIFLKYFDILKAPWIRKFPLIQAQNKLQQSLFFRPNNSLLFFLMLSRFQFYKYIQTSVNLLSHSVTAIREANSNSVSRNIIVHKKQMGFKSMKKRKEPNFLTAFNLNTKKQKKK